MNTTDDLNTRKRQRMTGDILIIDDKYEDLLTLDTILREAGYEVRAIRGAKAGLRAARSIIPDLVLLDIAMPDADGFQACEWFRNDRRFENMPIIFVSGYDDPDLKARAFATGGSDYITKPFDPLELLVRVKHHLERVQVLAKLQENTRLVEREHVARELHDSVNQTLFVLRATVQSMMMDSEVFPIELREPLEQLNTLSKSALAEMRTLLNELHPSQIQHTPIDKLLNLLVDAFRLRINAEMDVVIIADADLPNEVKLAFYRITQEALNNVAKYAGATRLSVSFLEKENEYRLVVEDNGCGFDQTNVNTGLGLHAMRERAEQNGIDLTINTAPNQGTRISAMWCCGS